MVSHNRATMPPRARSPKGDVVDHGSSRNISIRTDTGSEKQNHVKAEPTKLDQSILSSAISSGMPTFLLTKGVPIIDRRTKRVVSANTLTRIHNDNTPPESLEYPLEKPLCLRGHTPTIVGPSKFRMEPRRSVRGARGAVDVPIGAFKKPGVLGGLSVSRWVVEEETERAQRVASHREAILKDPFLFRRKRKEGGLLDYAEEMHNVKRFLNEIHLIRDESCPPKSGFSYRRVCHDTKTPDFYDTHLDSVRPRTVGYSAGHVRALSPTPCLTWGGREGSKASLEWERTGGSLSAVEACLRGTSRGGSTRPASPCPGVPEAAKWGQFQTTQSFRSEQWGHEQPLESQELETEGENLEVRPMWSRQGLRSTLDSATAPSSGLRPFSSHCDHLGRSMSREVLSRSTACLKPHQFDTTQRRSEYTGVLMAKREARLAREAGQAAAASFEKERVKSAQDEREGIRKFEGSLKEILAQKWEFL